MSKQYSISDRFIYAMGEIERMDSGMADNAEERYAVWRTKEAAERAISEGLIVAMNCVDSARIMREAANKLRAANETPNQQITGAKASGSSES